MTLTHAATGAAQGYLTQAGAEAFGAALARQFAADHARGSYGQDGMFTGGVSVALAGDGVPARAAPSQRRFPMHTLTVTGTDLAGRPDTGDIVSVINVDNIGRFSDPIASQNFFYHGSARFSVPAGHYMAIATFYTGTRLTNWHVVALPQFTVSGPATTVHLDARTATSRLQWVTPRPVTRPRPGLVNFVRIPAVGPAFTFFYGVYGNALWVSPGTSTRLTGALRTVTDAQLTSPPHYHGTPYEYDLAYTASDGVIPPLRYVVRPATLATEDAQYQARKAAAAGGWMGKRRAVQVPVQRAAGAACSREGWEDESNCLGGRSSTTPPAVRCCGSTPISSPSGAAPAGRPTRDGCCAPGSACPWAGTPSRCTPPRTPTCSGR